MRRRSRTSLVLAAATLLVAQKADSASAASDPAVQAIADLVSQTNYETYHLDIESMGLGLYGGPQYDQGYRNRDGWLGPGTLGNQEARLYLQDAFTDLGLDVSVQGSYLNVVGELPGTTTPEKIYVIGAHYDHIGGDRPGGDDNASGTAGILEAARVLSRYRFESTVRFIGFNAEEDGLKGSKNYVYNQVTVGGDDIVGVVNLDMILRPGSDAVPSRPINVDLETNGSMPWVQSYAQAAADYVPSLAIGDIWDGRDSWSDNDSFQKAGIPSMLVIENSWDDWAPNPEANSYYHTYEDASDRLANDPDSPSGITYDYPFATDVARTAVALIAQEAGISAIPPAFDPADFDQDGNIDLVDVDALTAAGNLADGVIVSPGRISAKFDLNGDGTVGGGDLDGWLEQAATANGVGLPYRKGDANLDGDVDVFAMDGSGDAQILASNLGAVSNAVWSNGDFNGDGDVDVWALDGSGDAQQLTSNLGEPGDVAPATAEAIYNVVTGELSFDVGASVAVIGVMADALNHGSVGAESPLGAPSQNTGGILAYFNPSGLPVGMAGVGRVLPTGLTADDIAFSYTPIGGDTTPFAVTIVVPEPSTMAMLLLMGLIGVCRTRVAV